MRRFRFRFQRVLEIKERLEEARRIELGEVMAVLNREREQLQSMEAKHTSYRDASRRLPAAPLNAALLGLNASYLQRLEREIEEQRQQLGRVEAIVEDKRKKLLEATRQRRVYEILKERDWEAHRREGRRKERLQLDEVGEQLYVRRRSEDAERSP